MIQQLDEQFLLELFKGCLTSKNFLEVISKHLKYHYIPEQSYKIIFEKINQDFDLLQTLPTIGSLTQHFSQSKDESVLKTLLKIRNTNVTDNKDIIIKTFEKFIINAMFHDLYRRIGELHNDGKQDKAIKLLEQEANIIANFSIKDTYYTKVFGDYEKRQDQRRLKSKDNVGFNKVPFGIHALDHFTRGGMDMGTSHLFLGRSGAGKSTILRWIGLCAARQGFRVIHFQGEGTENECLVAYDAGWTSIDLSEMEFGMVPQEKVISIQKANRDIIASGGEIFVKASDSFDDLTVNDCKDIIEDIEKVHGKVDLIIFDYLEIFSIKGKYFNSETGERKRREDIANKMTNIATSFNSVVVTATQANDIRPDKYNNPDFVMTRSDISEFKGALKPFSSLITLNQSDDECDNNVGRLWVDKFRKYKRPNVPIRVAQSLNNSRYYDSKRSLEMFWDDKLNKIKSK
jgi:replicative DNA helicase